MDSDWVSVTLTCFALGLSFAPFLYFLESFSCGISGSHWNYLFVCLSELPPEDKDESQKIRLFGTKVALGQIEAAVMGLAIAGVILFLVVCVLLGVVIHLERQKRLRRNRRSILDDGFKLMSKKNSGL